MTPHIPTREPMNRTFYYLEAYARQVSDLCHRADTYDADEWLEEAVIDIFYEIDKIADTIAFADWKQYTK
jgi:hypothetical protein